MFQYYWRVKTRLPERFGQACRVLARGKMNSCLVEFEDGYRVITSRNYFRKISTQKNMREKFAIIYKMKGRATDADTEGFIFEGTLEEAIAEATTNDRHFNYDREGVQIFKIEKPVFKKFSRQ